MKMYYKGFLSVFLLASILGLSACKQEGPAENAGQNVDQTVEQTGDNVDRTTYQTSQKAEEMAGTQPQELIYGSQLMTNDERNDYQAKMNTAKTAEEREFLRTQHHQSMLERAKSRGMTLPDEPPASGGGMGMGFEGRDRMQNGGNTP